MRQERLRWLGRVARKTEVARTCGEKTEVARTCGEKD